MDELEAVLKHKKTKGYLKDGFVVDSDNEDEEDVYSDVDSAEEDATEVDKLDDKQDLAELEDVGSELSEESYTYE